MALWAFSASPQDVFVETITGHPVVTPIGPQSDVVGRQIDDATRGFRLRYTTVTSDIASQMGQFFRDRRGMYEAFDFVNPNDALVYLVRFDTAMRVEYFTPGYFRTGGDLNFMVVAS